MKFTATVLATVLLLPALAVSTTAPTHALRTEAHFVQSCTGIELPYLSSSFSVGNDDDEILSCMLDHVMTTPTSEFGLDEPPLPCWPPGYETMASSCGSSLAMAAYNECTKPSMLSEDVMMTNDIYMSMSMSMSMSMIVNDDNLVIDDTGEMERAMLLERFCLTLEGLSTETGLECLESICTSDMPCGAPSQVSSEMPSAAPSQTPSTSPSAAPSASPSAAPSLAPSSAPSSSPTLIVSNPEGVQSSATVASVTTLSLVLLAAAAATLVL